MISPGANFLTLPQMPPGRNVQLPLDGASCRGSLHLIRYSLNLRRRKNTVLEYTILSLARRFSYDTLA